MPIGYNIIILYIYALFRRFTCFWSGLLSRKYPSVAIQNVLSDIDLEIAKLCETSAKIIQVNAWG